LLHANSMFVAKAAKSADPATSSKAIRAAETSLKRYAVADLRSRPPHALTFRSGTPIGLNAWQEWQGSAFARVRSCSLARVIFEERQTIKSVETP